MQVNTKTITYTLDNGKQRRLTVGRCSPLGLARYNTYTRDFADWMEEQGFSREWDESDSEDIAILRITGMFYARGLAVLQKVEEGDGKEFTEVERPAEWATVQGVMESIPYTVLADWGKAAQSVNPGLWFAITDDEKNAEAASADT